MLPSRMIIPIKTDPGPALTIDRPDVAYSGFVFVDQNALAVLKRL